MSPITLDPLLLSIPRIPLHVRTNFRGSALLCIYSHEYLPNLFLAKKVFFGFAPKTCLTISVGTVAGRFNDRVSRRSLDLPEPQKRPKRSKNNLNNIPLCNFEFCTYSHAPLVTRARPALFIHANAPTSSHTHSPHPTPFTPALTLAGTAALTPALTTAGTPAGALRNLYFLI